MPRHLAIASLLLFLLAASAPAQAVEGGSAPTAAPALVVTAVVEQDRLRLPATFVGSAEPRFSAAVAAEVDGLVEELRTRKGARVAKGEVLARLRAYPTELQLEEARAALAEVQARLAKAEADLQRARTLFNENFISAEELQGRQTEHDALEQAVRRQQATVKVLVDRLSRMSIRAPFAGQVVLEATEVGQWLAEGDKVLELADLSLVKVMVPIPEQLLPRLAVKTPADVTFDALPGAAFNGTLTAIVPRGDAAARTFPVEVSVANPRGEILAGMLARVTFRTGQEEEKLLVPKDAFVPHPDGGGHVVVVRDEKAVIVPVQVLGAAERRFAVRPIEGELAAGERVVTRGNERLRAGQPLREAAAGSEGGAPP